MELGTWLKSVMDKNKIIITSKISSAPINYNSNSKTIFPWNEKRTCRDIAVIEFNRFS